MSGGVVLTVFGTLAFTLGAGIWVALSLLSVGIVALESFRSYMPVEKIMSRMIFTASTTPELIALPLFILMAEILFRTRLSESLFGGLAPWTNKLPGRLVHVNILGCTMFAAVSGSSAATAATVGRITLTELFSRGYDRGLVIGSLAGAGTLGLLIPPSIVLIIYGVLAEVSILKLFIAGIVPGLMLAFLYMVYIGVRATIQPDLVPKDYEAVTWAQRLKATAGLVPVAFLILLIIGSMYGGYASPSEAAAVGVLGALIIAALQQSLNWPNLKVALMGAVRTTSMIGLIIVCAFFLSVSMGYLGVPRLVAAEIGKLSLTGFELMMLLMAFYIVLGCVLEGMSAIVMTLPITLPLVTAQGFDPIWFGVFLVIVVEMAQITPPVGFNLFVLQGMTGESISRIAIAALPFFFIMIAMCVLIVFFPEIVLFLPDSVKLHG